MISNVSTDLTSTVNELQRITLQLSKAIISAPSLLQSVANHLRVALEEPLLLLGFQTFEESERFYFAIQN